MTDLEWEGDVDRREADRRKEDQVSSYKKLAYDVRCSQDEVEKLIDDIRKINNKLLTLNKL
jgi:hypothetical protein